MRASGTRQITGWLVVCALALLAPGVVCAAEFAGSDACRGCHEAEFAAWRGSHHDLAMQPATPDTVLGNFSNASLSHHGQTTTFFRKAERFMVRTDGPDGKAAELEIKYTFGASPLQQYLVGLPGGRLQALGLAWDSRPAQAGGQRWFHLYPGEAMDHRNPLHWTGREQNWNYQCAECHSTDLRKNYDLASDSYRTAWSEINVACEACHGPGSEHVAWAKDPARKTGATAKSHMGLVVDLTDRDGATWAFDAASGKPKRSKPRVKRVQIELCARCHSRRGQIWAQYEYGKPLGNTHRLALLDPGLYYPDGQVRDEVYVYGSFVQSRMFRAGVTCNDCHEPHALKLRAAGNALCGRCHAPARFDSATHHHHADGSAGAACTACHMPRRVYMVIDARADHSMRVPRPDLSQKLGTPNACNGCHGDKTPAWAADAVAAWYPDSRHRGPHFGEALHAAAVQAPDAGVRLLALANDGEQPAIARATAIERLREHAQPQHLPALARWFGDPDPLVRAAAVRFLEAADLSTRVDQGWLLMDDPDRVVRLEAARVLAPLMRQQLPPKHRERLAQAIDEYRQAQAATAERPEAHLNLGLLAVATRDGPQAEAEYKAALRLDPAFAPAFVNLADLYRLQRRDDEGERVLRAGVAAVPGSADLRHALGLLLVRQQRMDEAIASLRRAAELAPERVRYAYVYAVALDSAGKTAEAVAVLRGALERANRDRELLSTLAQFSLKAGDGESARKYAERLVQAAPGDPGARQLLDSINAQTGKGGAKSPR